MAHPSFRDVEEVEEQLDRMSGRVLLHLSR